MSLPVPKFAAAERHATRTEVRVVEEVVATTSSDSNASRSCSERSAMSLRLPAFAASEGHVVNAEDARAVEEVIWISASEASEVEQEDEDILILSDTSSVTLPEVLPTRVESPEDSWSRSSGGIATVEGDVVLTELTDVPPAQLVEPLEVAREPSVGLVTAALDVEDIQVEQSLPGYAVCSSEEERSLPKPEDHLQPPNTPATPAQPERRAVGESYGFVPAVDSPPAVGSAHDSGAALPAQGSSSPSMAKSSLPVFTPLRQPSLQQAATGKDAERDAEFSEKPLSPVASLQHSPPKGGQHETELKSSAEVAAKTPEHESELDKNLLKTVVTSSYNLREKRTPTWKEEEQKTSVARPSRSRRKSGSVTPSQQLPTTPTREKRTPTWKEEEQKASVASPSRSRRKSGSVVPSQQLPTTPTRSGPRHDLNKSPETAVTPNRKTRAASEEPSTEHSRKKSRALESSPGRKREKASLVSPKRTTQSPEQKMQTPSPKAKSTAKATSATAGKPSKRLATPRPSRTSATPSSKRAGASRHVEKQASPSPTRQSSASPPKTPPRRARKSATPSPTRQKSVQGTRQQSTTRSPKQSKSAVRSPQAKTAKAPTPVKASLRTRGHTETKTPSHVEKTPEKAVRSTRASSTRQRRSATLSPQEKAARTPSPAKGSPVRSPERAKTSSPVEASAHVAEGLLRTPTRRGLRLTPDKQLALKGHVEGPTKPSGARRPPLDTIAEVDTSPTKSDTETSPTVPPTRKGRRNLLTEPDQSVPPKKLLVATRRSRRVSGNVALDTIAEIPDAEMEQEPQPTTSTSQRQRRAKRKADTALDAEGFKLSKPTELARKDSNSTPPKGEFLFSPPVTRHRQQQMSQSSGKPAEAEPVPSTSKEQAPKKTPRRKPIRYKLKPRTLEIPVPAPRPRVSATASSSKGGKKTPKKTAL
ncbi:hypothetical protein HPB49_022091 [Dermacentor silvarum]|uniref:Uncharacterized protein n=1 Tax=Dermacentor silvarum TaxID=543639 RepID=A0ACB8D0Q6_DERSI|nr:hypothetical protein HPB49_022091 [Dermacentor silvarum]